MAFPTKSRSLLTLGGSSASGWDFGFLGREGGFPVDDVLLADVLLFLVGLAGLADVDRMAVGERESGANEAVGAEQTENGLPVASVVVGLVLLWRLLIHDC
jgi:hypothetical protein